MHRQHGFAVIWILVVVAVMTAGISALIAFGPATVNFAAAAVFAVSLSVAALILWAQARRDLYAVCSFLLVTGAIGAIIAGAVVVNAPGRQLVAGALCLLFGGVATASLVYVARTQLRKETLPNILRSHFRRDSIYEHEGIQFVATFSPNAIAPNGVCTVEAIAQNCWDAPRTFTIKMEEEKGLLSRQRVFEFEASATVELPPLSVVALRIPLRALPSASGQKAIQVEPVVSGKGGVRARQWRAQGYESRVAPETTVFMLLVGTITFGGGMKLKVRVEGSPLPPPNGTDAVSSEILWQPDHLDSIPASRLA